MGMKGNTTMLAAEWVDQELIGSIKSRSRLSREWRKARKDGEPEEIQKACTERYLNIKQ